jgi:hypothetical protein
MDSESRPNMSKRLIEVIDSFGETSLVRVSKTNFANGTSRRHGSCLLGYPIPDGRPLAKVTFDLCWRS